MSNQAQGRRDIAKGLVRRWTGRQALVARLGAGLNQAEFWNAVFVTQSGGSRYESGRVLPTPVQALLTVAYGGKHEAKKVIDFLRGAA
jgi:hypothetical protein